jgi:hypothetical protein
MKKWLQLSFMIMGLMYSQNLVISGVYDGPLTGGTPKGVELYATANIADLSVYGLGSANNGGGSDGEEFTFPADAAVAGQYIYVATDDASFVEFFGFSPTYISGAMAINGDDAIELFFDGSVVDVFGDINVDGNGEPWEYLDGWAYRNNGSGPDGDVFQLTNWSFSGPDAFDGETTNATAANPMPIGTYSSGGSDTTPPGILSAVAQNATTVEVTFSETVEETSAQTIANYAINNGIIVSAALKTAANTVSLTTSTLSNGVEYTLTVNGVEDLAGNAAVDVTATFSLFVISSVAELRAQDYNGSSIYTLVSEAFLSYQQDFRGQKYIQDATAGIMIDDNNGIITTEYEVGDGISGIRGTLSEFGGMLQFIPVEDPGAATSSGNAIVPVTVTGADLLANFNDYEARLCRLENLSFDAAGVFANGTVYPMSQGETALDFRTTFFDVDYIGSNIPEDELDAIFVIPNERSDGQYITARDNNDLRGLANAPVIDDFSIETMPMVPNSDENVTIYATVTDDDQDNMSVQLVYNVNDGSDVVLTMIQNGTRYSVAIAAGEYNDGDIFAYNIRATDSDMQTVESAKRGFVAGMADLVDLREVNEDGIPELLNFKVKVTGFVSAPTQSFGSQATYTALYSFFDAVGIILFENDERMRADMGDEVIVYGDVDQYNGLTQLEVDSTIVVSPGAGVPEAYPIFLSDFVNDFEASEFFEGALLEIEDLTISSSTFGTWGTGDATFQVTDDEGVTEIDLRIAEETGLWDVVPEAPSGAFTLTAVLGQYDDEFPYTEGYQLLPVAINGVYITSVDGEVQKPGTFALEQNYPNPFNPTTTIRFYLPAAAKAQFSVFNSIGQAVFNSAGNYTAGANTIAFDAQNLASGVYYYRIQSGEFTAIKKMVLVK